MGGSLSRRNFVRIAVGSVVALPSVAGGFLIPRRSALAASGGETNAGGADDVATKITLVFASEVGFYVADVSQVESVPVSGARVKVSSRYNDKTVEGVTGDDGVVKLDVRNLAENPDDSDVDLLDEYAFNGTITMSCDGYRELEIPLTRIEGGQGVLVPTRALTDGLPYPRSVSFNEWDALYTENEFLESPSNTTDHVLSMEWRQLPSNSPVTVRLCDRGTGEVLQTKTARPSSGRLETSFEKPFLKSDGSDALPIDTSLDVELTQGGTTYLVPINLVTREAVTDDAAEQGDFKLEPLSYGMTNLGVFWPLDVPILGGGAVQSFAPDCYANVSWNPWGYIQFTLKSPSWGYYNDTGTNPDIKRGWGMYPRGSAAAQYNKMAKTAASNLQSTQAAYNSAYAIPKITTFGAIKVMGNIQLLALAKWDNDKRLMRGNAALQLFIGASASYTWNYFVGPFPVLITFGVDASLVFSVSCGFYSLQMDNDREMLAALFDFGSWKWDYTGTGFTMTFTFTPSLSVGLGVHGVASVSVKGAVTISYVTAWDWKSKGNQANKPRPHVITGYAVAITLVIHAFLCTATFKLKEWPFHPFWDNWEGLKGQDEREFKGQSHEALLRAMAETGITEPLRKMRLITSEMLEQSVEFDLDELELQSLMQPQGEREIFDWETRRDKDAVSVLDNGKKIHYARFSLVRDAVAEPLSAQAEGDAPVPRQRNMRSLSYRPRHGRMLRTQAYDPDTQSALPTPEPLELGIRGGIRPASDMMINQPDEFGNPTYVYGDPRFKIIDLRTYAADTRIHATCVFRIGVVSVGGEPRSRLIMTILNAGVENKATGTVDLSDYIGISKVLDFDIDDVDVDRTTLYDYDFDIALTADGDADIVRIVVVSGARPAGDDTKVANLITDIYYTYLRFEANDVFGRLDYTSKMTLSASDSYLSDDDMYHSVSNVRCATDGTLESPSLLMAFLDRTAKDPEQLLSENSGEVVTKVGFVLIDCVEEQMFIPNRDEVDAALAPIDEPCIYDLELLPQTTVYDADDEKLSLGQAYTLTLTSLMNETYLYLLRLGMNEDNDPLFTSVKQAPTLETSTHLVWWPNHDSFLTSYPSAEYLEEINENGLWKSPLEWDRSKWVLQKCWWVEEHDAPYDPSLTTPVLRFKQIGPDGFSFSNFGVNSAGSFIFWPQTRDADEDGTYGSRRVFEGDGSYTDEPEPAIHNLMACRINFEEFSDPFIVADVDHEMNTLQVVRTNDRYAPLEVLSAELVDLGDREDESVIYHASNIWYTAIPNLMCATATGCTSPLPLVAPGGTITFHVTVRNDGNTYLAGCTLQLCVHDNRVLDEDGKVVSEDVSEVEGSLAEVTFSEETLLVSCWNPEENGVMQGVEPDFSLAPGKRGVYKVVVKIPSEWGEDGEDKKWVSFVAREPVMAEGGSLTAQDEDDPVFQSFSVAPGVFKPYGRQMTPETDREQTHMQMIEVTNAVADGKVTADTPVTYATDGERPAQADPAEGADVPTQPDVPATEVDDAEVVWPYIGSGTTFRQPSAIYSPYRGNMTVSRGNDSRWHEGNASTSPTSTPTQQTSPVTPLTPVTPVATGVPATPYASQTQSAPVANGSVASPGVAASGQIAQTGTPAAEAQDSPQIPYTADGTDASLVAAAALAGGALAAAGLALKDETD